MYEAYWQLTQKPFPSGTDPSAYYPGQGHQATLLKLRYAVESRSGGALLAGGSGTGKSMLVRMLTQGLAPIYAPRVHLVFPQMATAELLSYLAAEFDAAAPGTARSTSHVAKSISHVPVDESVRAIQRALAQNAAAGRHAVLAIDEAHLIEGQHTWEAFRLLLNFEAAAKPAFTLLLVGQTSLLSSLERMPQLDERMGVKCLLRPLPVEETMSYVQHRLTAAGATRPIFTAEALETVHQLSRGIPRRINRLCDLALLVGFAEERPSITSDEVEAVAKELTTAAAD